MALILGVQNTLFGNLYHSHLGVDLSPVCLLFSCDFFHSVIFSVIAFFAVVYFQWFVLLQNLFSRCLQKLFSPKPHYMPSLWSSILERIPNRSSFALSGWGVLKGLFPRPAFGTGGWLHCQLGNVVICASRQCGAFPSSYMNRFLSLLPPTAS